MSEIIITFSVGLFGLLFIQYLTRLINMEQEFYKIEQEYEYPVIPGLQCFTNSSNSNDCHIACLILARGGSKGILHKNLAKINNTTLLGNSLKTVLEFGNFNSVWVSTDDDEIALEAKKFNVNIHIRDSHTANDFAPSILAVKEFIEKQSEIHIIGLIQCTSPFLKKEHLEKAFELLKEGYDSVFSVTRQHKLRWKIKSGTLLPDNFNPLMRPRRQDWEGELIENGMFYFTYTTLINIFDTLQSGRIAAVEIPNNESLEIDSMSDLMFANLLMQNLK